MRTLDLTPVMAALRERPGEFELCGPILQHRASRHSFRIERGKLAAIEADCSCAQLRADPLQAEQFMAMVRAWTEAYWRPLQIERAATRRVAEINRQFAAHFRPPGRMLRWQMRLQAAWRAAWEALTLPEPAPLALSPELTA